MNTRYAASASGTQSARVHSSQVKVIQYTHSGNAPKFLRVGFGTPEKPLVEVNHKPKQVGVKESF